jgi:hypothetical protein
MSLTLRPISLAAANAYVTEFHRHHPKTQGHKFSISVYEGDNIAGVVIVGRPIARALDDGFTAEVVRLCTNGIKNGCSILYAAAARACAAMGYTKIITYILQEESGISLKASGWISEGTAGGGSWSCPSRPREDKHPTGFKTRWGKSI